VNADWLGAPIRTLRIIGAPHGIKIWRAFGAPSHFQKSAKSLPKK